MKRIRFGGIKRGLSWVNQRTKGKIEMGGKEQSEKSEIPEELHLETSMNADDAKEVRKILLKHPELIHREKENGWTYFEDTRKCGPEVIQAFIDCGADLQWKDKQGRNLAYFCAEDGWDDALKVFIDAGIDINAEGDSETPLKRATLQGFDECVRLLLVNGAIVDESWLSKKDETNAWSKGESLCIDIIRGFLAHKAAQKAIAELEVDGAEGRTEPKSTQRPQGL